MKVDSCINRKLTPSTSGWKQEQALSWPLILTFQPLLWGSTAPSTFHVLLVYTYPLKLASCNRGGQGTLSAPWELLLNHDNTGYMLEAHLGGQCGSLED